MKKRKLLMLVAVLGALVAFSGSLQAESELLSDVFSVSFYRFGGAFTNDTERATILLDGTEAAGMGDWSQTAWFNKETPWDPTPPDTTADVLTSSAGTTSNFYMHDTRNGNSYSGVRTTNLGDGNHDMMDGHSNGTYDPGDDSKWCDIEVTDIPYGTYDVIFYIGTQAAQEGDGLARRLIRETGYYLGVGLANLINIFNPELIVIGGGLSNIGNLLLEPAIKEAKRRAFKEPFQAARFARAGLGRNSGVFGAAVFSLEEMNKPNKI